MTFTSKKALFVGYVFVALMSLLFRQTAYSIIRYFFLVLIVVSSSAIIMKYTNHRDLFYVLPLAISLLLGLLLTALGLSGGQLISVGESVVVLGLSMFVSGAIAYLLKGVVHKYMFTPKEINKVQTQLVFTFVLFFLYFTWISSPIVTFIEEGDIWTILVLLLLNVLYFVIHFVLTRFTKKLNFIWIALIGFVGLYTVFRFVIMDDSLFLFQLYLLYISYGLFLSFILIGDIFYLLNLQQNKGA